MFDMRRYFEDKEIPYYTEGENITEGWTNIQCPFPSCGDSKNHMGVNPDGTGFSCWMCGESGKISILISVIEACSMQQAKKILSRYYNGIYSGDYVVEKVHTKLIEPKGLSKEFPESALNYLKNRRFDPQQIINKYNIYWGGYTEFFKYRLVFPIVINREIVTYVGRDITGKSHTPYKNWPNKFSSRSVKTSVYNIDSIPIGGNILIVEGLFDVIRIGEGCVGYLGKTFTQDQIDMILSKKPKGIFIMLDSKQKDPEIKSSIDKLKRAFMGCIKYIEILELEKGDPCDLSTQEVINLKKDILL